MEGGRSWFRLAATALLVSSVPMSASAAAPDFHTDVAPILRDYCAGCHNQKELDGEFSVETFAALMKGGEEGRVIVPGKSGESRLIQVLTGAAKPKMPPKKEPQPSETQIATLRAWIDAGAKGPAAGRDGSILATLVVPRIAPRQGLPQPVTATAFSRDGSTFALARHASVELFDAGSRVVRRTLAGHPGKVNAVHFNADGSRVVTASGVTGLNGIATLWDANTGAKVREFGGVHRDILYDAEMSPDGALLATAGYDRLIVLWNTATGEPVRTIAVHNGAIFDLAFSPDGKVLASASGDETVKLWRVADGERLDTLNQPQGEQFSVEFTPDGRHVLAGGADNRIRMWHLVSRERPAINPVVHARFAHEDDIVKLAVSGDGRWLVSSSADRSLKLWTLPGLEPAGVFDGQSDVAAALAIAPDGKTFAVARLDGSVATLPIKRTLTPVATQTRSAAPLIAPAAEAKPVDVTEAEPNDVPTKAQRVSLPARITGRIQAPGDADVFRFAAKAGEEWVLEVEAGRKKSPLDSRVEVLDLEGRPIERTVLQAMRDSWFTFRGKDSDTSDDFRVHNWREMELNEYLYANGEVVKLWLYPRGPDSGFKVYPGFGKRYGFFGTTPLSHPLGEPCYIVRPLPPGAQPAPNGLPVFRLYFENDDEPHRRLGRDSQLIFTAPRDGEYLARLHDVRGEGGEKFAYTLTVRPRRPDFKITAGDMNPAVSPGSGREFTLKVERLDEFDGEIRVDVTGVPEGFTVSSPIVIEAGQDTAVGVLNATSGAVAPSKEAAKASRLTATATIAGREVTREVGTLGEIKLGKPAKVLVEILPDGDSGHAVTRPGRPLEFTIAPGETITARVRATRVDFKDRIELGKEDAGRNLPHGVFVDNIGLNGLLIVEGETERQFFITAAKWMPETTRLFHLEARTDGNQSSLPVILHVRSK